MRLSRISLVTYYYGSENTKLKRVLGANAEGARMTSALLCVLLLVWRAAAVGPVVNPNDLMLNSEEMVVEREGFEAMAAAILKRAEANANLRHALANPSFSVHLYAPAIHYRDRNMCFTSKILQLEGLGDCGISARAVSGRAFFAATVGFHAFVFCSPGPRFQNRYFIKQ